LYGKEKVVLEQRLERATELPWHDITVVPKMVN
jgi:predicted ATPase